MMNTVRLLNGTFKWQIPDRPTSIDIIFNQAPSNDSIPGSQKLCRCKKERLFFAIDFSASCSFCDGISTFYSTSTRISLAQTSVAENSHSDITKRLDTNHQRPTKNIIKRHKSRSNNSSIQSSHAEVLRDITNLTSRPPLCLASRPNDAEINGITKVNNMLSNFVVTYFFQLLSQKFSKILYEEFLFDFVKSEGSWKQFVESKRRSNHYINFFQKLSNQKYICIVPICCHVHWSLLIRRFIGNSWKILFIDSISQGSEQRFNDWRILFQDDDLFSGEWIKVKILQQSELECGARVCLHGVCFSLSKKKYGDIINDLSRFKDLPVRSRLMVSHICKAGYWSTQKWLSRTIGAEDYT